MYFDVVRAFRRPSVIWLPGHCSSLALPRYAPDHRQTLKNLLTTNSCHCTSQVYNNYETAQGFILHRNIHLFNHKPRVNVQDFTEINMNADRFQLQTNLGCLQTNLGCFAAGQKIHADRRLRTTGISYPLLEAMDFVMFQSTVLQFVFVLFNV